MACQHDCQIGLWCPEGYIEQVECASEAVKLGTATVGLKNDTHAVLAALPSIETNFLMSQVKISKISSRVGVSLAGISTDGQRLIDLMRSEVINYKSNKNGLISVNELMKSLAFNMYLPTLECGYRPYGVGFLVAAHDDITPSIFEVMPSSNALKCKAMAIGARSEFANAYLEVNLKKILRASFAELVEHSIRALQCTLEEDQLCNRSLIENITIGIVGKDQDFEVLDKASSAHFINTEN